MNRRLQCRASTSFIPTYGFSMGEPKEVWKERIQLLTPVPGQCGLMKASGNAQVKFMHCLPAFHDTETTVGKQIASDYGMDTGLEVTDDVFESEANIAFEQAENRLHTIKALLVRNAGGLSMRVVIALGGNALLKRGEPMTADVQRRTSGSQPRQSLRSLPSTRS